MKLILCEFGVFRNNTFCNKFCTNRLLKLVGSGASYKRLNVNRAYRSRNKCSYLINLSNIFKETTIPQHSVKRPSLLKSLFSSN